MESRPPNEGPPAPLPTWPVGNQAARDQEGLWGEVLSLSVHVETAFLNAVRAVCDSRPELVADVRAGEREVDRWEVRIEKECLRVLALYGLAASDLRRVVAAMRVNKELEGLADLAENLAKRSKKLSRDPLAGPFLPKLRALADEAVALIEGGLAALRQGDAGLARSVIGSDRGVDEHRDALIAELKQALRDRPDRVNTWLRLISCARNLERAADHATNLAEAVIAMLEGEIVRRGGPHLG